MFGPETSRIRSRNANHSTAFGPSCRNLPVACIVCAVAMQRYNGLDVAPGLFRVKFWAMGSPLVWLQPPPPRKHPLPSYSTYVTAFYILKEEGSTWSRGSSIGKLMDYGLDVRCWSATELRYWTSLLTCTSCRAAQKRPLIVLMFLNFFRSNEWGCMLIAFWIKTVAKQRKKRRIKIAFAL
jgi:hypothetical protein